MTVQREGRRGEKVDTWARDLEAWRHKGPAQTVWQATLHAGGTSIKVPAAALGPILANAILATIL